MAPYKDLIQRIQNNSTIHPDKVALVVENVRLTWREFGETMARVANALIEAGVSQEDNVLIIGTVTPNYLTAYFGVMSTGASLVPVSPLFSAETISKIIEDCNPKAIFMDSGAAFAVRESIATTDDALIIMLDGAASDAVAFDEFLHHDSTFPDVAFNPDSPLLLMYTSGTTGHPKGVAYSRAARTHDVSYADSMGMDGDVVTMIATPPYSNTTLILLLPSLALGGRVIYMPKFDAEAFLQISEAERATFTILVPVQYERIMRLEKFGEFDLGSYQMKICTSAPFRAALKKDIVDRWPGRLVEMFGMSEGGVATLLDCNSHPDKLHTVGKVMIGDIKFFNDDGVEAPRGEIGEIVGRSVSMMDGYYRQPDKTSEASWFDENGQRWQRTGDLGRMDEDGFVEILGRKKDMIISGGHNIYPSDLEAVLAEHQAVAEVAVVSAPSDEWGETPFAFVVRRDGAVDDDILDWANKRLGKIQRLSGLASIDTIPRNGLGKPLKDELRKRLPSTQ